MAAVTSGTWEANVGYEWVEWVRTLHVYNQQLNTLQLQLRMQDGCDHH
jgi:hypothetical protein